MGKPRPAKKVCDWTNQPEWLCSPCNIRSGVRVFFPPATRTASLVPSAAVTYSTPPSPICAVARKSIRFQQTLALRSPCQGEHPAGAKTFLIGQAVCCRMQKDCREILQLAGREKLDFTQEHRPAGGLRRDR